MKKGLRMQVWEKYDKRCAYCGCELEYKQMQVDHIYPKSKDWMWDNQNKKQVLYEYFDINDFRNLNPACRQCNFYKGDDYIERFRERLMSLNERVRKPFIFRLAEKYNMVEQKEFDGKFYFEKIKNGSI